MSSAFHLPSALRPLPSVSVVIPTWNGRHLLERFLPSVMAAASTYPAEVEMIVVDDGSTDGTTEWLPVSYPTIVTIRKERNEGFGPACNQGFTRAKHPVVVLLNNDVRVEPEIFNYLVPHFADPSVFAVCCKAIDPKTNLVETAGKIGEFQRGFWRVHANYDVETRNQKPETRNFSILASGGFSAFSAEKLRQLGGFNPLLAPFYWEDVDLSLRAWKRGWTILYEPRAIVHHEVSSTIGSRFTRRQINAIAQRNRLITHWINLHDTRWLAEHLLVLGLLLISSSLSLKVAFWRALMDACKQLPTIWQHRQREQRAAHVSDRELARLMAAATSGPEVKRIEKP